MKSGMIIGYRLRDSNGNCPDGFTLNEMFHSRDDADSWRSSNDGWEIVPVTKDEMKGKALYFSCLEEDVDWDEEWNKFHDEQEKDK
jgi:hypothetical protein